MPYEELSKKISKEANEILNELGLIKALEHYGQPFVHGSYSLDLMTWRDLDIYLEDNEINESKFFDLGKDLSRRLKPSKMNYRNELDGLSPHLPRGLYWGTYTTLLNNDWKIDVWAIDSKQFKQKQEEFTSLQSKVSETSRAIILKLKNNLYQHTDYRKKFFSVDIYEAVFEGIKSPEEFSIWLEKNKGLRYSF
ncbi:hypothetical protein GCM10008018_70850 [Paenibacillus marchantiophytorum]|uniref:Nucleotidyltransferase family protein n=2 Tax=Paenibacillus marchantiophytorum TaxID=1619310 RepID=A0ABQ1FJ49_9BACL|nr:hypothetical protein GCM10008018_70850 [Paenibacillus marchantiophytorum]